MNYSIFTCCIALLFFLSVNQCNALVDISNWADSISQLSAHSAFLPHPHMRDIKTAAKHGRILVITLVVSVGLVVLVSTAIFRSGKTEEYGDAAEIVDPAKLRPCVIAAAAAGKLCLIKSQGEAIGMSFSKYASMRNVDWTNNISDQISSATRKIGKDRVTVTISDDNSVLEVRAICKNVGAKAIANMSDDSIKSSIFTS